MSSGLGRRLTLYAVVVAFALGHALLFVRPVFLNPERIMQTGAYLPVADPIGQDLNYVLEYAAAWFIQHTTPYIGLNLYPPLVVVLFSPLLALDAATAYAVMTGLNLAAYLLAVLLIPLWMAPPDSDPALPVLLFLVGSFSYGLHFELEKGQFNLVAFALCLLAVYLYRRHPRWRMLAYVCLTLSIQLKIYPAIFLLMLVDDWRDWRTNLQKFGGLALINASLFFVLGFGVFKDFLKALGGQMLSPNIAMSNHSAAMFADLLFKKIGFRELFTNAGFSLEQTRQFASQAPLIGTVFLLLTAVCLVIVAWTASRPASREIDPHLLLTCTLGALIIPSLSMDYKLPLVLGPLALVLQSAGIPETDTRRFRASILLKLVCAFACSTTLYSYTIKPLMLQNNFPALLVMLLAVTGLVLLSHRHQTSPDKEPSLLK
jgi:hypothetical protein